MGIFSRKKKVGQTQLTHFVPHICPSFDALLRYKSMTYVTFKSGSKRSGPTGQKWVNVPQSKRGQSEKSGSGHFPFVYVCKLLIYIYKDGQNTVKRRAQSGASGSKSALFLTVARFGHKMTQTTGF